MTTAETTAYLLSLRVRTRRARTSVPVVERLTTRLVRMPNGCLEWTGRTCRDGYGLLAINHKPVRAHRLAWELANGPIPTGMFVLHHCDNPPCCDAIDTEHHLFLGTQQQNVDDMIAKGRMFNGQAAKTHCPQGHSYDEANTYTSPKGWRSCRTCQKVHNARAYAKTLPEPTNLADRKAGAL